MKKIFLFLIAVTCLTECTQGQGQIKPAGDDPNTITYKDSGGTQYRLVSIGDQLPRLYINGKELPKSQLEDYAELIERLQAQLWARQKKAAAQNDRVRDEQMRQLVADLVREKIIGSSGDLTSLRLDSKGFTVNGKPQSFAVFSRYKAKYLPTAETVYEYNHN
jgi:hypothetical protein